MDYFRNHKMEENKTEQSRAAWVDGIKGVMIFLVVLGHITGAGGENDYVIQFIHYFRCCISMPMFIIMTGMFTPKDEKIKKILLRYGLPYIIFDTLYVIWKLALGNMSNFDILTPAYVYWYLCCITIMKVLHHYVNHVLLFVASIVASFLVTLLSIEQEPWRILSWGRVALMYPIFLLGSALGLEGIKKLRKKKAICVGAGILSAIFMIAAYIIPLVPVTWATHDYYVSIYELMMKYVFLIGCFGIFLGLCVSLPNMAFLEHWGRNSLLIYLLHPYFIDVLRFFSNKVKLGEATFLLLSILSTILICWILSLDILRKGYDWTMGGIQKLFTGSMPIGRKG